MNEFFLIIATISVTLFFSWGLSKYKSLGGRLAESQKTVAELYDKAIRAEQARGAAEKELEFLKTTILQLVNRPTIATMTDGQVTQMVSALLTYVGTINSPEKLN